MTSSRPGGKVAQPFPRPALSDSPVTHRQHLEHLETRPSKAFAWRNTTPRTHVDDERDLDRRIVVLSEQPLPCARRRPPPRSARSGDPSPPTTLPATVLGQAGAPAPSAPAAPCCSGDLRRGGHRRSGRRSTTAGRRGPWSTDARDRRQRSPRALRAGDWRARRRGGTPSRTACRPGRRAPRTGRRPPLSSALGPRAWRLRRTAGGCRPGRCGTAGGRSTSP